MPKQTSHHSRMQSIRLHSLSCGDNTSSQKFDTTAQRDALPCQIFLIFLCNFFSNPISEIPCSPSHHPTLRKHGIRNPKFNYLLNILYNSSHTSFHSSPPIYCPTSASGLSHRKVTLNTKNHTEEGNC